MGDPERLGAEQLHAAVTGYRDALRAHQEALNRLNVYPVPDGDTGTNMALTMESVVAELAAAGAGPLPVDRLCQAIGYGALMGARGNSGVILCQILRGLADGLCLHEGAGPAEVAAAFRAASEAAYEAVARPVEGTILTVARAAANGAAKASARGRGLVDVLDSARAAAAYALERTPELLPVLREAGVVDAGAAGFALLLDVLLNVVDGRPVPEPPVVPAGVGVSADAPGAATLQGPRYEVMFLLEAADPAVEAFRKAWADLGDSIVVVGGDGLWSCHVHTDDVGAAIEAGVDAGRPRQIRVTDLAEQVAEQHCLHDLHGAVPPGAEEQPAARCAVVAVGAGDGIRQIFGSLGVRHIVAGGQSMNPSTGQILEAVEAAAADEVVVLPNNKNVVPAAEMVGGLTGKTVRVVRTQGMTEGLAALLAYDPGASAEENAAAMAEAARRVVVGDVTRAVRPATTEAGQVAEGDWLGITRGGIEVIAPDPVAASVALLDRMVAPEHELVTVIEGEGASAAVTRAVVDWLGTHRPGVSTEVHHGGQPLYAYLFSAE